MIYNKHYIKMYRFETTNENKQVILENENLNILLKQILSHENKGQKNNEDSDVIFEDSVGEELLRISEKYLKVILEITKMRKSKLLEKAIEDFNKLKLGSVSSIEFKNTAHKGIITIWDEDDNEEDTDDDENEEDADDESEEEDSDYGSSDEESIHMETKHDYIDECKKLKEENKKLKELLKSAMIMFEKALK